MHTGLIAPLFAQDCKIIQYRILQSQKIYQYGPIQCHVHFIPAGFIGGQEISASKVVKYFPASGKLFFGKLSDIQEEELGKSGDRQI